MTRLRIWTLMATKTLSITILCDRLIKKLGYQQEPIGNLNGTCWKQIKK
jgi:hypothetical protein